MIEGSKELVHGARPERIAYFWAVKSDTHGAEVAHPVAIGIALYVAVIRNVLEFEALDFSPDAWVEDIGNFFWNRIGTHIA